MATKKNAAKKKAPVKEKKPFTDYAFSIRPKKQDETLRKNLQAIADKKVRSLNEVCIAILEKYVENPFELFA